MKPNIVIILVDDLGYGDLGCYGNATIRTPNLDALAESGLRLTEFYQSAPWCAPSRAGLMTGQHPYRPRLRPWNEKLAGETTLPEMLRDNGYTTALIGKWHLGMDPGSHPLDQGFDLYYGTPGSNDVPAPEGRIHNYELFSTCEKFDFPIGLFDQQKLVECPADQERFIQRYTERARTWIREHREQPFFLYLAHNAPHVPLFPSEGFRGKSRGGVYGDVVEELDWGVGEVIRTLEELGLRKNTLIVFASDNGPWKMFNELGGSSGPLHGEKGTTREAGPRVPTICSWPGTIEPGVTDAFIVGLDLYATIAAITESALPEQELDSIDQSDVLLAGKSGKRTSYLHFGREEPFAYRSGEYKIHLRSIERVRHPDTCKPPEITTYDPPLLFDLKMDIGETQDIASEHPEILDRMTQEFDHAARLLSDDI